jgi:hypothetical protein
MSAKVANTAGQVTANLLSAALDKPARIAGENLAEFLGGLDIPKNAIKFFGSFGSAAKDATLDALMSKAPATDVTKYKDANYLPSSPGRVPDNNPAELTETYFRGVPRAESRQQPTAGGYEAEVMSPTGASIYGATGLGPETVGNLASIAGTGAALGLAGWGFGQLFGGSKPRSDYALAIQGNPYFGATGNSNIDAAQASAYYQQQTAQMKFQHALQLQAMRQQAQTPGVQGYGGAGGVPGSIPGIDQDLASVGRSIFGTGLRA